MSNVAAKHRFTLQAKCPVDENVTDVYDVTVITRRTLLVEDIMEAVESLSLERPLYQEELTEQLAEKLDGTIVQTVGMHSKVETTCRSGFLR
jgi:hypothetical protein